MLPSLFTMLLQMISRQILTNRKFSILRQLIETLAQNLKNCIYLELPSQFHSNLSEYWLYSFVSLFSKTVTDHPHLKNHIF